MIHALGVVRRDGDLFFDYDGLLFDTLFAALFDGVDEGFAEVNGINTAPRRIRMYYPGAHIGKLFFEYRKLVADYLPASLFEGDDLIQIVVPDGPLHAGLKQRIMSAYANIRALSQIGDEDMFNALPSDKQEEIWRPLIQAAYRDIENNPRSPLVYR